MTMQDLGSLGELIAAIATLGTLIYLAMQIRQNSESVRVQAGQTILTSINDALQAAASSPQQAHVMIYGQSNYDDLTEDEQAQYVLWIFGWFRVLEQAHYYYERGILDNDLWQGHLAHMAQVMKSPSTVRWWESRKSYFNESFRKLVVERMSAETEVLLPAEMIQKIRSS